jgi:pyruvate-formate lyase
MPILTESLSPRVAALKARLDRRRQMVEGTAPDDAPPPAYTGEEPFHAAWLAHEGDPFPVRLAHAQAAWRGAVQPVLTPGHLVQGTPPPPAIISYHTGVFAWDFQLNEPLAAQHPQGTEIVAYWKAWLAERAQPSWPDGLFVPSIGDAMWYVGICCHSTQDYGLAMELGLDGLREKVRMARPLTPLPPSPRGEGENDFNSVTPSLPSGGGRAGEGEGAAWYDALLIALDGVTAYILAHAETLELAAETCHHDEELWRLLAANCRHLAYQPPATFLQAVQLFEFLFLLNGHDSPGRMDQYLWPPLRRELEAGTLTLEAAQEIVDCLYLKLAEHVCYGATIGGQLPEGGDATNPLTWLCLNSIQRLRLLSPRTALRWHRETPDDLFAATVHSLAQGATYPVLVNDEVVVPAMTRRGATAEHARDYTFCGCGQVTPAGRAYGGYEDVILNGAKLLTYALHDGRDERSDVQVGPRTGTDYPTFTALEEAAWAQCTYLLTLGIEATNAVRRWGGAHVPDYLRSLLTHSCVERGLDWRAGGADYHEGMVDVVGVTTLCDSLTAIKHVVYDRRLVSLTEFTAILDCDWVGADDLYKACLLRAPKFGNEDADADGRVARWVGRLNDWLFAQRTAFGGPWGLDIIGWSGAVQFGAVTGATPDGRKAGDPLADCAGPAQGRDRNGITAALNSMLALPFAETHGPLALSLRLPANAVDTPEGEAKFAALLRNYLERGGQHLQPTVTSTETLHAARQNPDAHRDLIVRVGGFSAYFVELEARFQDDMIRRTEHGV